MERQKIKLICNVDLSVFLFDGLRYFVKGMNSWKRWYITKVRIKNEYIHNLFTKDLIYNFCLNSGAHGMFVLRVVIDLSRPDSARKCFLRHAVICGERVRFLPLAKEVTFGGLLARSKIFLCSPHPLAAGKFCFFALTSIRAS